MLNRVVKPAIGFNLDWIEKVIDSIHASRTIFNPQHFTVTQHSDGGKSVSMRQGVSQESDQHRFQVVPLYDGNSYDGRIRINEGTILGPTEFGGSTPGGNLDPTTTEMAVQPQFPRIVPEIEIDASIGHKVWVELVWNFVLEALNDESGDRLTDFQYWSLNVGNVMADIDFPLPIFNADIGTLFCPLPIAELNDDGGDLDLVQILHSDIAITFPLIKDVSHNPVPSVGEPPEEEDPQPPPVITVVTSGADSSSYVSDVLSGVGGGSCTELRQRKRPLNFNVVDISVGGETARGSNVTFGAETAPAKVGDYKAC